MSYGYHRRFLRIDLTTGGIDTFIPGEELIEKFIGGRGFAAKLMWDLAQPRVDALDPGNIIMFLPGPLTGTVAPCMRSLIVFKSPLTGTYCDSFHGGFLGPEIKYAGYDGIIITGRASSPAYLYIEDDTVEIREASHLWGLNTREVYSALHEELSDRRFELACIGPAGEKLVRFALIDCSHHRQPEACRSLMTVVGWTEMPVLEARYWASVLVDQLEKFFPNLRGSLSTASSNCCL